MKAFFRSKNFIVLAAVTCVLVAVIIYSACTGGGAISNIFGAVISPMQKVTAVATNNAQASLSEATRSYEDLAAENEQLKQQVNELNQQLVEFYQYKQENAQLKNYLGLKENNPDYQFVSASVINRDPNNLYYTFTLDQGSNAGVKVNDPVITDQGVVGWVSQVSAMYCEVTTILSPDTNISATDKVNRESGTISSLSLIHISSVCPCFQPCLYYSVCSINVCVVRLIGFIHVWKRFKIPPTGVLLRPLVKLIPIIIRRFLRLIST